MDMVVTDLSVARGGVTVLEGVSFRLSPGQVLVLRGANGIGKTTLLRAIAGLQPVVAGEVEAGDLAYGAHADGVKAMLTVTENLEFWAAINGVDGVAAALSAMNLLACATGGRRICRRGRSGGWGWRGCWCRGVRSGCWMSRRCRWMWPQSRCSGRRCGRIWLRVGRR